MMNEQMSVLIDRARIREGIRKIASEIRRDHPDQPLTLVCVLNGAAMFFTDLCRELPDVPLIMVFMNPAARRGLWNRFRFREFIPGKAEHFRGRHVIIVTEMIDRAKPMNAAVARVKRKRPASVSVAALLIKKDVPISRLGRKTYHAFETDRPVFGYGIGPDGRRKNLPEVWVRERDCRDGHSADTEVCACGPRC